VNSEQKIQDSTNDRLRALIVAAARPRFKRFGYAKTAMQEIAEDCRMSAANLYRYYDGKLEIGAAVAAAEQAALFAEGDRSCAAAPPDVTLRLAALFHAIIDATQQQMKAAPLLFELRLTVWRERPELRRHFLAEIERRILTAFAVDPRFDACPAERAESLGRLVLVASAPFVMPWMMQNTPFGDPRGQVMPLIRCLTLGMIADHMADPLAAHGG